MKKRAEIEFCSVPTVKHPIVCISKMTYHNYSQLAFYCSKKSLVLSFTKINENIVNNKSI